MLNRVKENSLRQINEYEIFEKVFMKYKILRMRAKLSFMAFEQG